MGLPKNIRVEARSIPLRDKVEFTVPLPPPLNGLFFNVPGKGRVKSRRYREWIKEAGWAVAAARVGHIAGPVKVDILLPNSVRADTDAYFKALLDLAVRHSVIEGDNSKIVRSLSVGFGDGVGAKVTISRVST